MLENVETSHCIFLVDIVEIFAKQGFKELFKVHVDKFTTPLATSRWRKKFFTQESLFNIARKFMNCNVYCATTTIEDHYYRILSHLLSDLGLGVFSTLNTGSLGLKTEQKVGWVDLIDDVGILGGLSHEVLVFFTPQSWYSDHPSDFSLYHCSYLFS